ncbi:MAG: glycosyltransferase [Leptolyngbyaceae cyanobacterium SL_1_1]|nr:glycosyltransferase [Leptolyngbyaceae cyanobacterium RM1_1_2]NJO09931.1 glycosyltransferase [Leptolyngbyaceae cyanobacterium SL_1_1]
MLFDLSVRGHHPAYIQHLIQYFIAESLPGRLVIVVSPRFFEEHGEVVEIAKRYAPAQVQFQAISRVEEKQLGQRKSARQRLHRTFQEWQLLCKYAQALRARHCLALYFDTCLRPLAVSQPLPCCLSGIYFRPTFHYSTFARYQTNAKARLQHSWEQGLLKLVGQRSRLHTVFSLDPFAVPQLNRLLKRAEAVHLPDPVALEPASPERVQQLHTELGIESSRTVALIFGALTQRKGVPQLLEAIAALSPENCQKLCLLLVGESTLETQLEARITELTTQKPIQIVRRYAFVPEADVTAYFQLADIVLAPYQRHVGMSGILLQAAAAGKPVLSSDYGLMGELVNRYRLGLAVDSVQPAALAQGMHQLLNQPLENFGCRLQMQAFAEQNSSTLFAKVIFQRLLSTSA